MNRQGINHPIFMGSSEHSAQGDQAAVAILKKLVGLRLRNDS